MTPGGLTTRQWFIRILALLFALVAAVLFLNSTLDKQAQGPMRIVQASPEKLTERYGDLHRAFNEGRIDEDSLFAAYAPFASSHPEMESHLRAWTEEYPESVPALLATAIHHQHIGWLTRSFRPDTELNNEMRQAMASHMRKAAAAYRLALENDTKALVAYTGLLTISAVLGDDETFVKTSYAAFREYPQSLELHLAVLFGLSPQWGGSEMAMATYANGVAKTLSREDLRDALEQEVDYWRAASAMQRGDLGAADALLKRHIETDPSSHLLMLKARLEWNRKNVEAALRVIDEVIALKPEHVEAHVFKAKVLSMTRQTSLAQPHWDFALAIDPRNPQYLADYAVSLHMSGRSDEAVSALQAALDFGANDHKIRDALASHYERTDRLAEAVNEMEVILKLRDRDPYYWRRAITLFANANDCRAHDLAHDFRRMCKASDCSKAGDNVTLALIARPRLSRACDDHARVTALSLP